MRIIQKDLREKLFSLLKNKFNIAREEINFSVPPDRKYGDLSTTIAFVIAKKEKTKPFFIGKKILEMLKNKFDIFSDIKLEGGGFVNFYFKNDFIFQHLIKNQNNKPEKRNQKVVVEHTSINPNKSAHIGHLRNACLGDTLAKSLRYLGYEVEIQNYIDDTGVQVADVVWGLLYYQKQDKEKIKRIENLAAYLWNLYAEVHNLIEKDNTVIEEIRTVLKKIEDKQNPEFEVSNFISEIVLKDHIQVMESVGVRYDLLVRESDIIELDFFKKAAEMLIKKNVMYKSEDPKKVGCLVIKYEKENIEKIIIRSDSTVTYIGKDIAYALWKVGLLKRDFYYREFFQYDDDEKIYLTDAIPNKNLFDFGKASRVYNVIGIRQSYLQSIISQVLNDLDPGNLGKKFIHFSYEMVALTPRCVKQMGFDISADDEKKAFVDVSGRKGIAVKADELLTKLTEKSREEVVSRNPEMTEKQIEKIARDIAVSALRYFMIKFNSNSVIVFDFKDALSFEGDTGPYLQYTLVRINSILNKLGEKNISLDNKKFDVSLFDDQEYRIYYEILLQLSLAEVQVELALNKNEISLIPSYTYMLCQLFNQYYHLYPVIAEKKVALRDLRLTLVVLVKTGLERLFAIMGIPVPVKM